MRLLVPIFFSLIAFTCRAQYYTIRGVIKDSIGNPIPYVTIQQAGRSYNGTSGNIDGNFILTVENGKQIHSTRLGYGNFQYTVHSDAILEIILPEEPLLCKSSNGFHQPGVKKGYVIFEIESHSYIIPPVQLISFSAIEQMEEDPNRIFEKVEVLPAFKGGMNAFCKYLSRNVKGAKEKGNIQLKFFIGVGGSISNVQVLKSYHKKIDERIVAAFYKGPSWVPAIQNGRNVGVWCIMDLDISKTQGQTIITLGQP